MSLTHVFSQSGVQGRLLFCLIPGVCAVVLLAHLPVLSSKARMHDDHLYVYENPLVQNPSWESARRFFVEVWRPSTVGGYYQPLTMVSLMVDRLLTGSREGIRVYHRTSLLLHVANTALLALLLYLLFPCPAAAAAGALLFGLHPITVDSACWLSERKTLLAGFFALWSLIAYVRFTRERRLRHLIGCVAAYVLALLSKPIALPLPFMMLLLDYWPLDRLRWRSVVEKLPLFALAGVFTVIAYVSQLRTATILMPGQYDPLRVPWVLCHNAAFYLGKVFWPVHLSPHYEPIEAIDPFHPSIVTGVVVTCVMICLLFLSLRWTRAVFTGGMIAAVLVFPASGVASFTIVLAANRYFYIPMIGFVLVGTWWLTRLVGAGNGHALRRRCLAVAAMVLLIAGAETIATRRYLRHWTTTIDLCEYMLSLFPRSCRVHDDLGIALRLEDRREEAVEHFRLAIRDKPTSYRTHYNLALVLDELGAPADQVVRHYRRALQIRPAFLLARVSLAWVRFRAGNECEGLAGLAETVEMAPYSSRVQYEYGRMLVMAGRHEEGFACLRRAMEIPPRIAQAMTDLAWFLATHPDATVRNPGRAVTLAERAEMLARGRDATVLDTLAAAYASDGQYAKAVETAEKALALAEQAQTPELADQIRKRLQLYQHRSPCHEDPRLQLARQVMRRP